MDELNESSGGDVQILALGKRRMKFEKRKDK